MAQKSICLNISLSRSFSEPYCSQQLPVVHCRKRLRCLYEPAGQQTLTMELTRVELTGVRWRWLRESDIRSSYSGFVASACVVKKRCWRGMVT
nr:hypothetical protein CFP56_01364 [Quercus suber]